MEVVFAMVCVVVVEELVDWMIHPVGHINASGVLERDKKVPVTHMQSTIMDGKL